MDVQRSLRTVIATGKVLVGADQTVKAVARGEAKMVILAQNAPDAEAIRAAVPSELLNRFHTNLLFMPPLSLADYAQMAQDALDWVPGEDRAAFQGLITNERVQEAYQARKGVRFLEELAAAAQRQTRRAQNPRPPRTAAYAPA